MYKYEINIMIIRKRSISVSNKMKGLFENGYWKYSIHSRHLIYSQGWGVKKPNDYTLNTVIYENIELNIFYEL